MQSDILLVNLGKMYIKGESIGRERLTPCPLYPNIMIGSSSCIECRFFGGRHTIGVIQCLAQEEITKAFEKLKEEITEAFEKLNYYNQEEERDDDA